MAKETKYPRGKIELHPDVLTCLVQEFSDYLACMGRDWAKPESLGFNPVDELLEIISRNVPTKPHGEWIAGRDGYSCPRCPCCGSRVRSGTGSSSFVRDDRCRKCGQLIDWSGVKKCSELGEQG